MQYNNILNAIEEFEESLFEVHQKLPKLEQTSDYSSYLENHTPSARRLANIIRRMLLGIDELQGKLYTSDHSKGLLQTRLVTQLRKLDNIIYGQRDIRREAV